MRSAGSVSLTRNPLAPARMASVTYSSSSNVVTTTTCTDVARGSLTMRCVACRPSRSGIRMSIRTTSGSRSRAIRTASSPRVASPTTCMSGSESMSARKPPRTRAWSSATTTRITSCIDRNRGVHGESITGYGFECATKPLDAFTHAQHPVATRHDVRAATVVAHDDVDKVVIHDDAHLDSSCVRRVPADVGQRFLHHSIDGLCRGAGQREVRDVHLDLETLGAQRFRECSQVRCPLGGVAAHDAEHAAYVVQRLAARVPDRAQRGAR